MIERIHKCIKQVLQRNPMNLKKYNFKEFQSYFFFKDKPLLQILIFLFRIDLDRAR